MPARRAPSALPPSPAAPGLAPWRAALGLLLLALAAVSVLPGRAHADTLVSNLDNPSNSRLNIFTTHNFAQSFRTGANREGYRMSSVELRFV